jgi:tetratricopeptide (TPR) repeat protein
VAVGAGAGAGLALALLMGLVAAGLHSSLRLLVIAPLLPLFFWKVRRGARWPLAAPALFVLGAAGVLAYLPIRSAIGRVDALDWGHPSSLTALWQHAGSAARIRAAYAEEILSPVREVVLWNARTLASMVEGDLGLFALFAAAGGLLVLISRRRGRVLAVFLAVVVGGDFVWGAWVNPMGTAERQNAVLLAAGAAVLAGVGAASLARRFGRAAPFAASAIAFLVALPAVVGAAREKWATRSDAPRAWSEAALASCPPRMVVVTSSDSLSAGLYWLGQVEGARPDAPVLVAQHLWDHVRTRVVLVASGAPSTSLDHACWEPGPLAPPLPPQAPLARPGHGAPSPPDPEPGARLSAVFAPPALDDPNARRQYAAALSSLGRAYLGARQRARALHAFRQAALLDPENAQPWVNLGVLAAQDGDAVLAATLTERGLASRPNHPTALVNAARYHLSRDQDPLARRHLERAVRVAPTRADAWALLGTLEARAGRYAEARKHLEKALSLDPGNSDARINLNRLP